MRYFSFRWRWSVNAALAVVFISILLTAGPSSTALAGPEPQPGSTAAAPTSPAPSAGDSSTAAGDTAAAVSPDIAALLKTAAEVRALVGDTLEASVDPAGLFDIPLGDEQALQVEAERLRAVIAHVPPSAPEAPAVSDGQTPPSLALPQPKKKPGEGETSVVEPEPLPGGTEAPAVPLDPKLWDARLELDRARLSFYELPPERRAELLAHQAERRQNSSEANLKETEARALAAEAERLAALAEAQKARTEAERLVGEEKARLLGVASAQAELEAELARGRQSLAQRAEETLGMRRRAREIILEPGRDAGAVDDLYVELRRRLRATRDELAASLSAKDKPIPAPGEDGLVGLSVEVDHAEVDQLRADLAAKVRTLGDLQSKFMWDRTQQLHDEAIALNLDRLSLLPYLSPEKRNEVTGFGLAGLDQAAAELRQITLVLRFHLAVSARWVRAMRQGGTERSQAAVNTGLVGVKWILVVGVFFWWRRRAEALLTRWRDSAQEEARRSGSSSPSRLYWALGILLRVRKPIEWLLLAETMIWLLPDATKGLLEVELGQVVLIWNLAGWLAVLTIDAVVESGGSDRGLGTMTPTAQVRWRSLRLIGRTVVVFGLILAISGKLVGEGTIYGWVLSTFWIASVPILLLIVRWWREVIFERMNAVRKKQAFEKWVVDNRVGWKSFPAAVAAGAYLFVLGAVRAIRTWVGGFDTARRMHAYLFRRGMDKLAEEKASHYIGQLPLSEYQALSPEVPSIELVMAKTDNQIKDLIERIDRTGGGLYAVVGERGAGKTTVLGQVCEGRPNIFMINFPPGDFDQFRRELVAKTKLPEGATLEEAAEALDAPGADHGLLLDNAHRLIHPVMGGLADLDRLIETARKHSVRCTWVFAIDDCIWRFFEQARGARPTFDEVIRLEPWREEEIVRLLTARSRQAGVEPSFAGLVDKLPPDADEVDKEEAAQKAAAGYYRMLWDYSAGNPGVALHIWRRSLGVDYLGRAKAKYFQPHETNDLESLPDATLFVLRAVAQMDGASPDDIVRATMLRPSQVEDALRYGMARDYFELVGDRYRIKWGWFRTITRYLQRRHLLSSGH